jgi:hypothetical protein
LRITVAFLLWLAAPAMAQCVEPPAPAMVDGNAASEDQMRNLLTDVRGFITQSEIFQACVTQELTDARAQAATEGHPLDPTVEANAKARIAASQKAQDRVSQASNATLGAYKLAHAR